MKKLLLLVFASTFLMSCIGHGDDDQEAKLKLNINGLEDLGADYVYEGWIIVDGAPVSTGIFTVDENGELSSNAFYVNADELDAATVFVLTIEPTVDPDPAPSNTKLLSGPFNGDAAQVGIMDQVGDFADASGSFFLRTPTDEADGMNNGNDQYGIWFGTPGAPPAPNFNLPVLPEGWVYEGWVVIDGVGPITIGQFGDPTMQVADMAGPFSGPNSGPPIPGEDYFENAPDGFDFPLDLRDRTVVVSVEPYPDNSPAPFLLKPLVGMSGQDTAPTTYDLNLNTDSFPTGWVEKK